MQLHRVNGVGGTDLLAARDPVAQRQTDDQAAAIADAGSGETTDQDWMPLGVFAIVTEGQTKPEKSVQLAINPEGIVRGNLIDELTDDVKSLEGSLDRDSQRVAVSLTDDKSVVAEMGLYDLTQDTLTVLIHKGPDQVDTRGLVRLSPPENQGSQN